MIYLKDLIQKIWIKRKNMYDPIKDSWSIHVDSTKTTSSLRSMVWPGYFAYCKANSDQFGGVYIGYGIKNVDIPFMQQ